MNSQKVKSNELTVKILPGDVKHLRDDDVIIVSRAQLNAQLAFVSMNANGDHEVRNIQIMKCAINNMIEQEKKQKTFIMGAAMTVSDVKRIFSKIESMPRNSFAKMSV